MITENKSIEEIYNTLPASRQEAIQNRDSKLNSKKVLLDTQK